MKTIKALILGTLFALSLGACGKAEESAPHYICEKAPSYDFTPGNVSVNIAFVIHAPERGEIECCVQKQFLTSDLDQLAADYASCKVTIFSHGYEFDCSQSEEYLPDAGFRIYGTTGCYWEPPYAQ